MRSDLPGGTVTFLFTDVESSTELLRQLGAEGYAAALAEHRRIVRRACAAEGGVEVDTQGDAFFVAFPTAPGALAAARAINECLEGPIRLRMGLHTGAPLVSGEGYVGPDVHRAARIASAGHGGQILVSQAAASLVDVDLRDLGVHRLKDLGAPERIYQLGEGEFPRLRSLYRTNLPIPANPLVGRKKELADVLGLLVHEGARMVTLTGPGGVGKTRLALGAVAEAADEFLDGMWFADLTPLRDPALVLPAIGHAVGAEADLARELRDSRCLLLVDNFEQVVAAAPDLAELLASCPRVVVLVTSREALRVAAEREYALGPLPEAPAVELFRRRVSVVGGADVEYAVGAEICRRLDGLPLAIELAAARTKVFEPEALLHRLEDRLPLLVSRARDLPERQRALHATIEWSYELLDVDERQLFRRLAVFRGGATLEAIEAVTGADADLVELLVDKSLLRRRRGRLVMLETIREFARDELEASPEVAEVRRRQAEVFLAVAESANLNAGDLRPGGQRLDIAITEQDNIRAGLGWALDSGETELALRFAVAMEQFWVVNDPHEGVRWFSTALAQSGRDVDPIVRAHALRSWASSAHIAGESDRARELCEESLTEFESLGDEHGRAVLLHRLGIMAMHFGELERACELVEESHEIHERHQDIWGLAQTVGTLGAIERDAGNRAKAYELIAESAQLAEQAGVPWWQAGMLVELSALSLEAGRIEDAESKAREALALAQQLRDYGGRVFGVGVLACVAGKRGDVERAGLLWGAIEDDHVGAPLGGWLRHRSSCEHHIRTLTGSDLEAALARGRELPLDEAVEFALGNSPD